MTESEFHDQVDATLEAIEAVLDDASTDLDVSLNGGVLTIICENGSRLILTRQTPVKQLWLATKADGIHFDWDGEQWRDGQGRTLQQVFSQAFTEQAGESLDFSHC
ncbi:iron donor protein CyaY [Balneatrix alpica]|uniref:Iron-sulfur cluster assembly protein CyaY n=1 Tax=Balneatrix alpica TaxID=75684 RepID=A0ABV5ZFF4_9GAMM|nr:iron donor protein CyaY [Balneatrix alpica]